LRKLPKTVGTDGERLFHVIEKEKEGLPKSRAPKNLPGNGGSFSPPGWSSDDRLAGWHFAA
jgi:hypothetical protein